MRRATNRAHWRKKGKGPVCRATTYWERRGKRPELVCTRRPGVSGFSDNGTGPAGRLGDGKEAQTNTSGEAACGMWEKRERKERCGWPKARTRALEASKEYRREHTHEPLTTIDHPTDDTLRPAAPTSLRPPPVIKPLPTNPAEPAQPARNDENKTVSNRMANPECPRYVPLTWRRGEGQQTE